MKRQIAVASVLFIATLFLKQSHAQSGGDSYVSGEVHCKESVSEPFSTPCAGANVSLVDSRSQVLSRMTTLSDGKFKFKVSGNDQYNIQVDHRKYQLLDGYSDKGESSKSDLSLTMAAGTNGKVKRQHFAGGTHIPGRGTIINMVRKERKPARK